MPKKDSKAVAVPEITPRAAFLAGSPKAAALQRENIAQIRKLLAEFRPLFRKTLSDRVNLAEKGRQIGVAVLELEDTLPGKRLTEDFWRQLPELFTDAQGQKVSREMLEWFAKIARHHSDKIDGIAAVRKVQKQLEFASGEPEFQLEGERGPQVAHIPPSPLALLKSRLSIKDIEAIWTQVRQDEHLFPGGRIREDLRDILRIELGPVKALLTEVFLQIGL